MSKFEYRAEYYITYSTTTIEKEVEVPLVMTPGQQLANDLPQRGAEGWELVSVLPEGVIGLWAFFKRPEATKTTGARAGVIAATAKPKPEIKLTTDAPVELSSTGAKVQTSLQVVSRPEGGISFPQALPPAQRSFPSRDYSTGFSFDANGSPDPES